MLQGISPLISPELLATMCRMGHGDELIFGDAHFPGESFNNNIIRADGLKIPDLLEGVLPLFALDTYVDHSAMIMDTVPGDTANPEIVKIYQSIIEKHRPGTPAIGRVERFAFYEQTKKAFVVVMTGDTNKYANLILKKGVTPI